MNYQYIVNPVTNRKCRIDTPLGRKIIKGYAQTGGMCITKNCCIKKVHNQIKNKDKNDDFFGCNRHCRKEFNGLNCVNKVRDEIDLNIKAEKKIIQEEEKRRQEDQCRKAGYNSCYDKTVAEEKIRQEEEKIRQEEEKRRQEDQCRKAGYKSCAEKKCQSEWNINTQSNYKNCDEKNQVIEAICKKEGYKTCKHRDIKEQVVDALYDYKYKHKKAVNTISSSGCKYFKRVLTSPQLQKSQIIRFLNAHKHIWEGYYENAKEFYEKHLSEPGLWNRWRSLELVPPYDFC